MPVGQSMSDSCACPNRHNAAKTVRLIEIACQNGDEYTSHGLDSFASPLVEIADWSCTPEVPAEVPRATGLTTSDETRAPTGDRPLSSKSYFAAL